MSSESTLDEYEKIKAPLQDYERQKSKNRGRWPVTAFSSRELTTIRADPQRLDIYSNKFLELLLFCSTIVLWMSGVVMLAFGFYLVFSHYGWAVMTGSTMYLIGMMLQTTSALSVLTAAGVTTTLLSPDTGTPKRALVGLAVVLISAILLLSEVIVCSIFKVNQELKSENFYSSILNNSNHKTFSQQDLIMARRKGYECKDWKNQQCNKLYIRLTEAYINFLIGSACITLTLIIIVVPILVLVYKTTVHKITRVQPSTEYSNRSIEENYNQSVQELLDDQSQ